MKKRKDIKMFLLVVNNLIIQMGGGKNGSLYIEKHNPLNVVNPIKTGDLLNPVNFPTLVCGFRLPDGRGDLVTLYYGVKKNIVIKVRVLYPDEVELYSKVILRQFDVKSNVSCLRYFYNIVTFACYNASLIDIQNEVANYETDFNAIKGKIEIGEDIKNRSEYFLGEKKRILEEFKKNFSIYSNGDHLLL